MDLSKLKKIYFLGIGGIGMSALARYFNSIDLAVCGYDKTTTELTKKLENEGISVRYHANASLIPEDIDLVVFTPAIPDDFEEWSSIYERNIPVMKRSEVLALLCNEKKTIAVAGTHGKTTVSAMISHIFSVGDFPFIAFVGGIISKYEKNVFLSENSEWIIAEADEYDRSFLSLKPDIAVINAIDADHLDIYDNKNEIENSFNEFIGQLKKGGTLFINSNVSSDNLQLPDDTSLFGINSNTGFYAENINVKNGRFFFDVLKENQLFISSLELSVPGRYNIENALAAIAVADKLGIETQMIAEGLKSFPGVRRRFELIYEDDKKLFYDDYAHHPKEIIALIDAVRELLPEKFISGIFQPHLFSRTRDFADDFAEALSKIDHVILTDIYPAREKPIKGITSLWLLDKINSNTKEYVPYDQIVSKVCELNDGVILTIGAGDIDKLLPEIRKKLEQCS